ncbi:hypothetical protein [Faunimonas pinastri]|uniref:hypothetical protein n=1 Tax=Faunimonas pinastri TaxID=1855383 RepID=UPI00115FAD2C|nr:hypothetical protein [Faunimonas pinastri]
MVAMLWSDPSFAWKVDTSSDPLTDTEIATALQLEPEADFAIATKCWKGQPERTLLFLITGQNYDESASYRNSLDGQFRVDKEPVQEVSFSPEDRGGMLVLRLSDEGSAVSKTLSDMERARTRIIFAVGGTIHVFPAGDSRKALGKFNSVCNSGLGAEAGSSAD